VHGHETSSLITDGRIEYIWWQIGVLAAHCKNINSDEFLTS